MILVKTTIFALLLAVATCSAAPQVFDSLGRPLQRLGDGLAPPKSAELESLNRFRLKRKTLSQAGYKQAAACVQANRLGKPVECNNPCAGCNVGLTVISCGGGCNGTVGGAFQPGGLINRGVQTTCPSPNSQTQCRYCPVSALCNNSQCAP
jgi:hypothetical protein